MVVAALWRRRIGGSIPLIHVSEDRQPRFLRHFKDREMQKVWRSEDPRAVVLGRRRKEGAWAQDPHTLLRLNMQRMQTQHSNRKSRPSRVLLGLHVFGAERPDGAPGPPHLHARELLQLLLEVLLVRGARVGVERAARLLARLDAVVQLLKHGLRGIPEGPPPVQRACRATRSERGGAACHRARSQGQRTPGLLTALRRRRAVGVHPIHAVLADEGVEGLRRLLHGLVEGLGRRVALRSGTGSESLEGAPGRRGPPRTLARRTSYCAAKAPWMAPMSTPRSPYRSESTSLRKVVSYLQWGGGGCVCVCVCAAPHVAHASQRSRA